MQNFSEEQLLNPPSCYRGAPFWAWNGIPDRARLQKQIKIFKEMGFGGFYIHARTGLSTPYLGPDFLDAVAYSVQLAERENMQVHLYDEDRFPSGSVGGLIGKNPRFRARTLSLSKTYLPGLLPREEAMEKGTDYLVGAYRIAWNPDGTMHTYTRVYDVPQENLYYAYSVVNRNEAWFNGSCYADLLNPDAVRAFIQNTHEVYKARFGDKFGKSIPTVFTDEPQLSVYGWYDSPCRNSIQHCVWSDCLPDVFWDSVQIRLEDVLPEVFFLRENHDREIKYLFYKVVGEQFARAYADQIGAWCDENGLLFTGHYHSESSLSGQTCTAADLMRQYRAFSLPGIDILRDSMEFTTVKQANSIVRQYGREGLMCELYGVNHYDATLADYKFMGDWLSALGVTFRVPHLSYLTMEGEAKRDYPPSFGYQSPWSPYFESLETHYARLNMLLKNGKPVVKIAVLHPAESFWLYCSNMEQDAFARQNANEVLSFITDTLVEGMLDFDFLSESLLPTSWNADTMRFGEMDYDVILVPPLKTIRKTTLSILTAFARSRAVLFVGDCPERVNGKLSDDARSLYNACPHCCPMRNAVLQALLPYRSVTVRQIPTDFNPKGTFVSGYAYRLTADKDGKWLFMADTVRREPQTVRIEVPGQYKPYLYNTLTGKAEGVTYETDGAYTIITKTMHFGESALFRLSTEAASLPVPEAAPKGEAVPFAGCVPYATDEPNVLLLDMPSYALDGEAFSPPEEILRMNNRLRERLGWEKQGNRMAQPWSVSTSADEAHTVTLRYTFENTVTVSDAFLALEHAASTTVLCNGETVPSIPDGYYIDTSIEKIKLPTLYPGTVTLTISVPFTKTQNPEACYVLGSFGVQLTGSATCLTALPEKIGFSNAAEQRFPFYGAGLSYFVDVTVPQCDLLVTVPHFSASLVRVFVDEKEAGLIAFAPYKLRIPGVSAGTHTLRFTAVGGRYNTLAPLHNTADIRACTPASWRPDDAHFTPSYHLHSFGILAPPKIEISLPF